jgi:hypothetical protein
MLGGRKILWGTTTKTGWTNRHCWERVWTPTPTQLFHWFSSKFQFPFGYLPLPISPVSGERMDLLSGYCRKQEGVEMDDSHLPHPTMLPQETRIQRTDFETLMHGFMKDDVTHNSQKESCYIDCNDVMTVYVSVSMFRYLYVYPYIYVRVISCLSDHVTIHGPTDRRSHVRICTCDLLSLSLSLPPSLSLNLSLSLSVNILFIRGNELLFIINRESES